MSQITPCSAQCAGSRSPTMREIAARAEVSAMTVSRALHNNPKISAPVRKKINRIASEMGYRPDPVLTKMMHHLRHRKRTFTSTIAAITSITEVAEAPWLKRAREEARARAENLGYGWEDFFVKDPSQFNRPLERTLVNRGIEGILLLQMATPTTVDQLLTWDHFSVVIATPSVLSPAFPRVVANHFQNARILCECLSQRGCVRIGFVGPESFCVRTRFAFPAAVAWQGMVNTGAPVAPLIFKAKHPSRFQLRAWFEREGPDAIIGYSEEIMPDLAGAIKPRADRSVVLACTNVNIDAGRWAGIDEGHDRIGRKAVDVLTSMINRNEKNLRIHTTSTLIDGEWFTPAL